MKKRSVFLFFGLTFILAIAAFMIGQYIEKNCLPYFGNGKMETKLSVAQKRGIVPVPPFSFINAQGQPINISFVQNKIWIADFFFTRCGSICPKMSSQLQFVQHTFRDNNNVKIISFTCDPEHDSAQKLQAYANVYHANPNQWQFVTGSKQTLYRYARKGLNIVATDGDGGENDFIHSQNLVLIDSKGYIRGYYDGTDVASVQKMTTDIKKLL